MDNRLVVAVGDIHGCLEEFDELLKTISYNKETIRLVSLGDLMDRGPDPVGCVRRVRELNLETVMGNHEEKHLRWRKHEATRELTGKANPMKHMSNVESTANRALSEQDVSWMKQLPVKIQLMGNMWGVHAGCEPRYSLAKQNPKQIMRVRFVDDRGIGQSLNADLSQPEGTVYWTEMWQGPESIVYGHCVHNDRQVRRDEKPNGVLCLGIDTGCCFGGSLTAAVIHSPDRIDLVQVKAKQVYYTSHSDGE